MARIFITGSADGLGQLAAAALVAQGQQVVLHARNAERVKDARDKTEGAEDVAIGDLRSINATKELANELNAIGRFDAVIHNAGVYQASANDIFTVNVLAPYILTCLMERPDRLIYLSSDLHKGGRSKLETVTSNINAINYSDSKLHVLMLAKAVARKWRDTYSNAVNPGWVPTKMGGAAATDDLKKGYQTQVWLATSNEEAARVSGSYFFHKKQVMYNLEADDVTLQEQLLDLCAAITGIGFPG
jgi:NAD(P)-dependent dehydrogenase (short-subunit alcohol dehydrogenase family)